jgi:hypothetical protein
MQDIENIGNEIPTMMEVEEALGNNDKEYIKDDIIEEATGLMSH